MSGRKKSEVASVLTSFEKSQDEIISKYGKDIENLLNSCRNVEKDLNGKLSEIDNINLRVSRLKEKLNENRKRSKEIRNKITHNPHYCDNEYREANQLKGSNREIEVGFSNLSIQASNLLTTLKSRFKVEVKEFWKSEVTKIEDRLNKKDYYFNIKEYYLGSDSKRFISLEEFMGLYNDKVDEIKKIRKIISSNQIKTKEEVVTVIKDINKSIGNLEAIAQTTLGKFKTENNLAFDVYDAMEKLGFDVDIKPNLDGEIITSYKVECRNGDDIDFTAVKIGDDGNIIIDIDHKHGKNYNNCGVKWRDIKKSFNNKGIPMTTVFKDGRDILNELEGAIKINTKNKIKGR